MAALSPARTDISMKIDDISAFVAVVRNQSVSAAADALGLTQSAITRRVQNFEQDLGVELLDRSVKPPRPSPTGRRVYEQCARVLLDAVRGLHAAFPDLHAEVVSGWGAQLVEQVAAGTLDAAVGLFPSTKVLPDGLTGRTLGRIELAVVGKRGSLPRRAYKLRDVVDRGWVLNPDGCGFRAGLARALAGQGLAFKVNLDTFGADLQLGLVANGMGLGLMPRPILERSPHRNALDVVNVTDFRPELEIWLIQPRVAGPLQQAIDHVAATVEDAFAAPLRQAGAA
jgi:DNA-binding transcriptional LysR family regulator